jgi:hypothetical protein
MSEAGVPDRHARHELLLTELEPAAERLVSWHLSTAKEWLPTSTCPGGWAAILTPN